MDIEKKVTVERYYANDGQDIQKVSLWIPCEEFETVQKKTWYKTMERYMDNKGEKDHLGDWFMTKFVTQLDEDMEEIKKDKNAIKELKSYVWAVWMWSPDVAREVEARIARETKGYGRFITEKLDEKVAREKKRKRLQITLQIATTAIWSVIMFALLLTKL